MTEEINIKKMTKCDHPNYEINQRDFGNFVLEFCIYPNCGYRYKFYVRGKRGKAMQGALAHLSGGE